jgi:hypothetical protein
MKQNRTIPAHILCALRVRGNLAYVSAEAVNRAQTPNDREVYREIFAARVMAFLKIVSEGARSEIERNKRGVA